MNEEFKEKMNKSLSNIYGFKVEDGKVQPPSFELPDYVWERVKFFTKYFEDGMTFYGCLNLVLAYEEEDCKQKFLFGATEEWLPVSEDFKKWRDEYAMREMELAAVILYT